MQKISLLFDKVKIRGTNMLEPIWFWIFFNIAILALILMDLKFHSKEEIVSVRRALGMTAFWLGLALAFNIAIYFFRGMEDALNFLAGYLIEYSLSIDNIFVFILLFSYFNVPPHLVHKVLFWGIIGAIVMRTFFIIGGIALIQSFAWLTYLLGAFLIFTGIKFAFVKDKVEPEKNFAIRLFRRYIPITDDYVGSKFFVIRNKKILATPLLLVLLAVETTDLIFAIDSIPAIIGITTDIFIVYTSNIFAILGLRSLYFALAGIMKLFHYLHYGLALILIFIGLKMLLSGFFHVPIVITLGTIGLILTIAIVLSMFRQFNTITTTEKKAKK